MASARLAAGMTYSAIDIGQCPNLSAGVVLAKMTIPTDTETDEELLTFDVSDDTLERAAAIVGGGTLTRVYGTAADCGCSTTAADCGCWATVPPRLMTVTDQPVSMAWIV